MGNIIIKGVLSGFYTLHNRPDTPETVRTLRGAAWIPGSPTIEENTRRQLQDKIGVPVTVRQTILRDLFDPDGLSEANSSFQFDELANNILTKVEAHVPDFVCYLIFFIMF